MDERDSPPISDSDLGEGLHDTGPPYEPIPNDVLEHRPVVLEPLDLMLDPQLGVVIGRSGSLHKKYGAVGLGLLGAVTEQHEDILQSLLGTRVWLDLVSPHVVFVAGKRGSGKSYTMGVIVEGLAQAARDGEIEVAVIVVDTVDVFRQMIEPNGEQASLLKRWGLAPQSVNAQVYVPRSTYNTVPADVREQQRLKPLSISPAQLSVADWGFVLEKDGQLSTTMDNLLHEVLDSLKNGYTADDGSRMEPMSDFSIRDMIRCVERNPRIAELYKNTTRVALIQRLRRAERLGVFHPSGISAQDLSVVGQVSVIDVAPLGSDAERVLAILTNLLCRQILSARMEWTEDGSAARDVLPPTWLIVDEAHTLVPRTGQTPAKEAIISYTKLGRRYGCSLVLCTQQPSAVADDAISQADILISHTLSHEADIRALQQRAPAVMPAAFRDKTFISSLPSGVAMVFDESTENRRGFMVQVRPRVSRHGGSDRLSVLFEASALAPEPIVPPSDIIEDAEEPAVSESPTVPTTEVPSAESPDAELELHEVDLSGVSPKTFGPMPESLLQQALLRQVLYGPLTHRALFWKSDLKRSEVIVTRDACNARDLLRDVMAAVGRTGLRPEQIMSQEGLPFVLLRGSEDLVAVATVGRTPRRSCVAFVVTGGNRSLVEKTAEVVRRL
ncbi:MAG: ATP-binding protein [Candidatus Thorarchaeota archaeon]